MTDVPHITYPFHWGPHGNAAVVEQDTLDEIINCVEVVVRTDIGALPDLPAMGITDPTFKRITNMNQLSREINEWEPRAAIQLTTHIDDVDQLVEVVQLEISTRGQI